MVESCICLLAWMILITASLSAVGWAHLRVWGHFVLYESLICVAEDQGWSRCHSRGLQMARTYLPFVASPTLHLQNGSIGKIRKATLRGWLLHDQKFEQSLQLKPPTRIVR